MVTAIGPSPASSPGYLQPSPLPSSLPNSANRFTECQAEPAGRAAGRARREGSARGGGLVHELGQVELLAEPVHQLEVGLDVVDVVLLVGEDLLEDVGRGDVALLPAHR